MTQPVTLPLESIIMSTLSDHDLLLKIFEGCPRQSLGENISQLLNSINLEKLGLPLIYLFTKPYGLGGIYLLRGVNCGGKVLAKIHAPAVSSCIDTFIVVSPIGSSTA